MISSSDMKSWLSIESTLVRLRAQMCSWMAWMASVSSEHVERRPTQLKDVLEETGVTDCCQRIFIAE